MKRILIISHAMELGGAERALLGLLENIDTKKVAVDLFLLRHEGELLPLIPKTVNLLQEIPAYTVLGRPISKTVREGHLLLSAARLVGKFFAKVYDKKNHLSESAVAIEYSHKYTKFLMPKIQPAVEYDLAISFLTPHYFAAEKVRAKKKAAWIHTDYSTVCVNQKSELKMWGKYDSIISISDKATEGFLKTFPELEKKIVLIENILPRTLIEQQAKESVKGQNLFSNRYTNLLSIGRFCTPKNFDNVPDICKKILNSDLNVKWYLIGFGADEALIRKKIKKAGMQANVIILGKKENPYPYIKACDLYVQPSRYEGKSVTVREAQMLGKPVVITNFPTSKSQLKNGVDGIVVPLDNDGCANGITDLIQNPAKMNMLSENCRMSDYSNSSEIEKIYRIIGD